MAQTSCINRRYPSPAALNAAPPCLFALPMQVGHYSNGVRLGFEFWLNRQADVVFFLDMILMFRLAYFDKNSGLWVFELPKIRRLYLR